MAGNKAAPLLEARDLNTKLVFDLVYNPLETPLIHLARQLSIPIVTGVEMFVHQGARQFEIWTGKPAPEEEMFRVVLHALRQQAEADAAAEAAEPQSAAKPPAKAAAKPSAKASAKPSVKASAKPSVKAAAKPKPPAKAAAKPYAKAAAKPKPPAKASAKAAAKPKPPAKASAKKSSAKAR
jgi:3-dehydroquinate dehydratase/shikimate dehydrogenase